MIFDNTCIFSDAQAITGDAASTNILDLGTMGTVYGAAAALSRDVAKSTSIPIVIQVVETFNTLTSMTISVQCDDNTSFSSAKSVLSQTIALAGLTAGAQSVMMAVPAGINDRYLRLYYDVTGTDPTAGKITAGIVAGVQTNGVSF